MTELTAGRACPTLRTLLGDCTLASSNSTVYCATFDEDESDDSDEVADNEASESDDSASCWAVEEVAVADLAGLEIQAVDLSTVDGANLNQLNLTNNSITSAANIKIPSGLESLYLNANHIKNFEFQDHWGMLQVLDISDNPIANISASTKSGPLRLIAHNLSLTDVANATFPDSTQSIDLSLTPLTSLRVLSAPTDLHQLIVQNSSIRIVKQVDFTGCKRPFAIDLTGNRIETVQGVAFPPNLRSLLWTGSNVTYFEIRESDESILAALEEFQVGSLTLNRSCASHAAKREIDIANSSYPVCVLTDSLFASRYGIGDTESSAGIDMWTPFALLFGISCVIFVGLLILIGKRKRWEQQREAGKTLKRGNTLSEAAEASRDTALTSFTSSESDLGSSRRGYVITDDVRKDPDFENLRIALSDLERKDLIAKGGGGLVYLGRLISANEQVVLKQMYPEKAKKSYRVVEKFMAEIRLYSKLKHPKVVAFRGIAWSSLVDLSMVLEYMSNGDLAQFLDRQRMMDKKRDGWCWSAREEAGYGRSKLAFALDIADALLYLHSFADPVIHRDLKAQNVLLSNKWIAKLGDFGASRVKSGSDTAVQMTAEVGTVSWIAPEVIRGDKYDQQVDIYSFGVVMCEIDTCSKPFTVGVCACDGGPVEYEEGDDEKSIFSSNAILAMAVSENRIRPAFHHDCPRAIREIGLKCMDPDPRSRPTAKELYLSLQRLEDAGDEAFSRRGGQVV